MVAPRRQDVDGEEGPMKDGTRPGAAGRREQGMALLVTVMIIIMIAAMAMAAIQHAGEESAGGRRTKTALDALFGASAGVEFSRVRIAEGNLAAFSVPLDGGIQAESRRRSQSTPQPIESLGTSGLAAENMINVGSAVGITNEMYRVNVTATTNAGAVAEVEAKVSYTGPGSGSGTAAGGGY
jgi:opacity protein-like surface antigen